MPSLLLPLLFFSLSPDPVFSFLVLLGVSSAQINAAPKDIVSMGAHENAMLAPLQKFMDELIRFNPQAQKWKDQITNDPEQREFWERSRKYPDLVLEGIPPHISIESPLLFFLRRNWYPGTCNVQGRVDQDSSGAGGVYGRKRLLRAAEIVLLRQKAYQFLQNGGKGTG
jgi:hypothetical protein